MAESATSNQLHWYDPPLRGIIPLDGRFHIGKRLRRTLRQKPYDMRFDTEFRDVMQACAEPTADPDRRSTWINTEIVELYSTLHRYGHAHSIEAWDDGVMVGGLYGVSLGTAFFGESMFSRKTDASKIALVYLVSLLRHCGFTLLDTQFKTEHLAQFGTLEIPRETYHGLLDAALVKLGELEAPMPRVWHELVLAACGPG